MNISKFLEKNFLNVEEIVSSKSLQILYYFICLSFFASFYGWIQNSTGSINSIINGSYVCPPYLQNCSIFYFFEVMPYGYSQSTFYVILFLVLGFGIWSALNNQWKNAQISLFICLLWKVVYGFVFGYGVLGNYDYYDMVFALIFIFVKNKEYFAKLAFVCFYFFASTIKIHEGWILANYFKTFSIGAPLFSENSIIFFTNIVILMQIAGCWFLLSKDKFLQRAAFVYFMLFHIYSGIIVEYRYITISITVLFILFYEYKEFKMRKIERATITGYILLLLLFCGQFLGILIPGDQKKTLEGNYWGLYMFEANHQCISTTITHFNNSMPTLTKVSENHVANKRCDPYQYWFQLKTVCNQNQSVDKIQWTFDHSINGHPYERIVDVENACNLTYNGFGHNEWIKLDGEAHILSLPVYKNSIKYDIDSKIQIPTNPYNDPLLLRILTICYWLLWTGIIVILVGYLIYLSVKEYDRKNRE